MRIAVVVGSFPELSTTFILDQIIGLLELGHDVQIFAHRPRHRGPLHPQVTAHGLLDRTHHWFGGRQGAVDAGKRTLRVLARDPRRGASCLVRSLHPRYGIRGSGGYLWSLASAVLAQPAFDVVLCHFGENAIKVEHLRRIGAWRAPLATVFHGYDLSRFLQGRRDNPYADLFASGELMLPISEHWRDRLVELGCAPHKIIVNRMGIDCERFQFQPRRLGEGEGASEVPVLLSVCRLTEKKGIEPALQALARVRAAGGRFHYHVVGDGPLRSDLERNAAELGVSDVVTFHGACTQDEVLRIQRQAHLFLAPSVTAADGDQEGIPVSLMEAMALGMPVVSSVHTGIPELVEDGRVGFLAPERDVTALAACIQRLLDAPESWEQLGRQGRTVVEAKHDNAELHRELADHLQSLAKLKARPG